jgi:hypothetical protein
MRAGLVLIALVLAGCSAEQIATDVTRRTARAVVLPIIQDVTPPPADALATDCIMANASNAELNVLARNIGASAGTLTVETIRSIIARTPTLACIAGKGLAPVVL